MIKLRIGFFQLTDDVMCYAHRTYSEAPEVSNETSTGSNAVIIAIWVIDLNHFNSFSVLT